MCPTFILSTRCLKAAWGAVSGSLRKKWCSTSTARLRTETRLEVSAWQMSGSRSRAREGVRMRDRALMAWPDSYCRTRAAFRSHSGQKLGGSLEVQHASSQTAFVA